MRGFPAINAPLPLMGRGRGGVISEPRRADGNITPSQPSPIEGEGIKGPHE
jgi:hypothetical protein